MKWYPITKEEYDYILNERDEYDHIVSMSDSEIIKPSITSRNNMFGDTSYYFIGNSKDFEEFKKKCIYIEY